MVTPGTVIESSMLEEGAHNYICASVFRKEQRRAVPSATFPPANSMLYQISRRGDSCCADELARICAAASCSCNDAQAPARTGSRARGSAFHAARGGFARIPAHRRCWRRILRTADIEQLGFDEQTLPVCGGGRAAGAIYTDDAEKRAGSHIYCARYALRKRAVYGAGSDGALRNLELTEASAHESQKRGSLLWRTGSDCTQPWAAACSASGSSSPLYAVGRDRARGWTRWTQLMRRRRCVGDS